MAGLLDLARAGDEIIIVADGAPVARITGVTFSTNKPRVAGLHQGAMQAREDFDAPLPDQFWLGES